MARRASSGVPSQFVAPCPRLAVRPSAQRDRGPSMRLKTGGRGRRRQGNTRDDPTLTPSTFSSSAPPPKPASLAAAAVAAAASIVLSVAPAAPAAAAVRLPPIDSDPARCERAFVGNTIGQANAVSDKVLDLREVREGNGRRGREVDEA